MGKWVGIALLLAGCGRGETAAPPCVQACEVRVRTEDWIHEHYAVEMACCEAPQFDAASYTLLELQGYCFAPVDGGC